MQSLRFKLTLVYSLLGLAGLFLAMLFFYFVSTASVYQWAQSRAEALSDEIAYSLEILAAQNDLFAMQRLVEKSSTLEDVVRIAIVDTRQYVLAHTNQQEIGQYLDSTLLTEAILQGRQTSSTSQQSVVFVRPLHGQAYTSEFHDLVGALSVEIDVTQTVAELQRTFGLVSSMVVGIFLIFYIGQYFIVKTLVIDRLRQVEAGMARYMEDAVASTLTVQKSFGSDDEINKLTQTYNYLVASLKHSQKRIEAERDFALLVMDSMGEGLTITNALGAFEYVNPAYAGFLGIASEKLIGRKPFDVTHPDDHEKLSSAWKLCRQGKSSSSEVRLLANDGNDVYVLVSSVPRIQDGQFTGSISVITNISERALLEQMKTDFINRASHELRTPLTTAILMVNLLEGGLTEEQQSYIDVLKQELNRQRLLLNDLLVAGRIESKRFEVHLAPVELLPILQEAIASVRPQAASRQMEISLSTPGFLPPVNTDRQALLQILMNLLSNAIKFSNAEGFIDVAVTSDAEALSISVQDHGIGIPARDLPYIAGRFFRAQNATELEIPGTGIGLHIVHEILDSLGGRMEIASVENEGTRITVNLPLQA